MAGMLTLKNALSSAALASQDGVLVGLRVTLMFGLAAPMQGPTSVPAPRDTVPSFREIGRAHV